MVVVHTANIHDSMSAENVLLKLAFRFPNLMTIFADGGCQGELVERVTIIWMVYLHYPEVRYIN
jgi:hypothetical protein